MGKKRIDLTGQRFGRLVVISLNEEVSKQKKCSYWNCKCDCCGKRGGKLESHHKDGYNWCRERRMDTTNGVCLCETCHKEFHKQYGKGNNTEAQYIEFKEEKQKNVYINSIS